MKKHVDKILEGDRLIQQLKADEEVKRTKEVQALLHEALERFGLTQVEFSIALGTYANKRGTRGSCAFNAWKRGAARMSDKHLYVIKALLDGKAHLYQTGQEGQRRIYKVSALRCSGCGAIFVTEARDGCVCGGGGAP